MKWCKYKYIYIHIEAIDDMGMKAIVEFTKRLYGRYGIWNMCVNIYIYLFIGHMYI